MQAIAKPDQKVAQSAGSTAYIAHLPICHQSEIITAT